MLTVLRVLGPQYLYHEHETDRDETRLAGRRDRCERGGATTLDEGQPISIDHAGGVQA